jgi:hypothetical protein
LSEDQLGFHGGFNLYQYVLGNPTRHRDPLGLITFVAGVGVSLVGATGAEGSFGVAVNPGVGGCGGVGGFASGGVGAGVNVGGDVFVGAVAGGFDRLSGQTANVNITAGPMSVTMMFDLNSGAFVGATAGISGFGHVLWDQGRRLRPEV